MLGTNANHPFRSWGKTQRVSGSAEAIARDLPETAWTRLSAGEGTGRGCTTGITSLSPTSTPASAAAHRVLEHPPLGHGACSYGAHVADGSMAFFSTWCPLGTSLETLVAVEGRRWTIEDAFETAKNELGLDHNETRSWHGWHRHFTLVMTAFAMLAAIRHHANTAPPPPPKRSTRALRARRP